MSLIKHSLNNKYIKLKIIYFLYILISIIIIWLGVLLEALVLMNLTGLTFMHVGIMSDQMRSSRETFTTKQTLPRLVLIRHVHSGNVQGQLVLLIEFFPALWTRLWSLVHVHLMSSESIWMSTHFPTEFTG